MPVDPRALLWLVLLAGAATAAEPPPDPELLEFLGEFTTDAGEWVDPMTFDRDAAPPEDGPPEPRVRHEDLDDR